MAKEIRARYSKGKLEPLDNPELEEGQVVVISIKERPLSDTEWEELTRYAERTARKAGITSEEQVNEMFYEQRHGNSQA